MSDDKRSKLPRPIITPDRVSALGVCLALQAGRAEGEGDTDWARQVCEWQAELIADAHNAPRIARALLGVDGPAGAAGARARVRQPIPMPAKTRDVQSELLRFGVWDAMRKVFALADVDVSFANRTLRQWQEAADREYLKQRYRADDGDPGETW